MNGHQCNWYAVKRLLRPCRLSEFVRGPPVRVRLRPGIWRQSGGHSPAKVHRPPCWACPCWGTGVSWSTSTRMSYASD